MSELCNQQASKLQLLTVPWRCWSEVLPGALGDGVVGLSASGVPAMCVSPVPAEAAAARSSQTDEIWEVLPRINIQHANRGG